MAFYSQEYYQTLSTFANFLTMSNFLSGAVRFPHHACSRHSSASASWEHGRILPPQNRGIDANLMRISADFLESVWEGKSLSVNFRRSTTREWKPELTTWSATIWERARSVQMVICWILPPRTISTTSDRISVNMVLRAANRWLTSGYVSCNKTLRIGVPDSSDSEFKTIFKTQPKRFLNRNLPRQLQQSFFIHTKAWGSRCFKTFSKLRVLRKESICFTDKPCFVSRRRWLLWKAGMGKAFPARARTMRLLTAATRGGRCHAERWACTSFQKAHSSVFLFFHFPRLFFFLSNDWSVWIKQDPLIKLFKKSMYRL